MTLAPLLNKQTEAKLQTEEGRDARAAQVDPSQPRRLGEERAGLQRARYTVCRRSESGLTRAIEPAWRRMGDGAPANQSFLSRPNPSSA